MLNKIYELIWKQIGDEPWTEKVRREQKNAPLFFMLIFLTLGILIYAKCKKYWWQVVLCILLGVLCGHFFW